MAGFTVRAEHLGVTSIVRALGLDAGCYANTTPWPVRASEPARIDAIDKHPYSPRRTYPADDQHGRNVYGLFREDPYVPAYHVDY